MRLTIMFCLACLFCMSSVEAQKKRPKYNQINAEGQRIGYWIIKGKDGKPLAKGRYNENGEKEGRWRFYISPIGRYADEPDVVGQYENGVKNGRWELVDSRTKIKMKGKFTNDSMNGVWIVYNHLDDKLAAGKYLNGIRQDEWLLFKDDRLMAKGRYTNSQKKGRWQYDYYIDKGNVHIKGEFDFGQERASGKMEYYKVDRHPRFGTEELLVGTGSFLNGLREGRWIEYKRGLNGGELVATGYYDGEGRRTGLWKTTLDADPFRQETFNDGKRQGVFKTYYDDGTPKYSTAYEDGLEVGFFTSYYESGEVRAKGAHTILKDQKDMDTLFYKIELPYEYKFKLVDQDFERLNYNAISWIDKVDYSVSADSLEEHWQEYLSYGLAKSFRIQKLTPRKQYSVRIGEYVQYHINGKEHIKGKYLPKLIIEYNPLTGRKERGYAKTGEWIENDPVGYLRFKYFFKDGILVRMENNKGRKIDPYTFEELND